jgi:hypothetical protein
MHDLCLSRLVIQPQTKQEPLVTNGKTTQNKRLVPIITHVFVPARMSCGTESFFLRAVGMKILTFLLTKACGTKY